MNNMNEAGKRPLIILGSAVILLLLLSAWSLKADLFTDGFHIDKSVICLELDENRKPLHISSKIQYGSRQICLWLQYSKAKEGNHLDITWYYGKDKVLTEQLKLMTADGVKAFYLLREEGTPLPVGSYKAVISTPVKTLSEIKFDIVRRK